MTYSFASLVVLAVLSLVRSAVAPLPAPLQGLSHALAGIHGYQTMMTVTTSDGAHTTSTIQSTTIFLHRGTSDTSYTVLTVTTQGHTLRSENLNTATRLCERTNGAARWSCQQVKATPSSAAALKQTFGHLSSDFRWSAIGAGTIDDQPATGYRAVSAATSLSSPRVTATLWVASKTNLPLQLQSTTTYTTKSGTTTEKEVVSWSKWNDRSLSVPSV